MRTKKKSIELLNTIKVLILKKNLIYPNESILLTISGGQDSIFLLIVFFILKKQWNLNLNILYINHLWQQNSLYTYLHISKILFCLNINFIYSITLKNLNTEEQGRYWRSKNYYRLLQFYNCSKLLTGHTLTDQIETFFFNITRGSSFNGVSSLKIKKNFPNSKENDFFLSPNEFENYFIIKKFKLKKNIERKKIVLTKNKKVFKKSNNFYTTKISFFSKKKILTFQIKPIGLQLTRPLITKTRFDINNISKSWQLPLFPDQTNEDTKYSRNRLRKQILPTFRFFLNPKIDLTLYRYTEILNEEEQYIETLILKLIQKIINEDNNIYFFNIALFYSLNLPLQRRICFFFFKEILKVNYNFIIIDSFAFFLNKIFILLKKDRKLYEKNQNMVCVFFPEIGTIYISKTFLLVFK